MSIDYPPDEYQKHNRYFFHRKSFPSGTSPETPTRSHISPRWLWNSVWRWFMINTFTPRWLRSRWSHPALGYAVAVLLQVVIVFAVSVLINVYPTFLFLENLVILGVMLIALGWGAGPSIFATIVGTVMLIFLISPPHFSLAVSRTDDVIGVCFYVIVGLVVSVFASQTQRARHHAEALSRRLETIIEAIPDSLAIYDQQGKFIKLNKAARETVPAEQQSVPFMDLAHLLGLQTLSGEPLRLADLPLFRALRGEIVAGMEMRCHHIERLQDRFVSVSAAPLRGSDRTIEGAVTVTRDITARHRLEQRLQALEREAAERALRETTRLMDEFIGIAGHELRTPLTAIKGNVQLAKRQLSRAAKLPQAEQEEMMNMLLSVDDLLDRAERQVRRQNRLVSDLMDVSRIHTGQMELRPEWCEVSALVREMVEEQVSITPARTIDLELPFQGKVPVMADPDRLRQVVSNYLSNALKYSEADKEVLVSVEQINTQVRVSVRDEGPGLTPAQQQRIWERFYRSPGIEVKSGSGVGLGLGLHISQMIIERLGGQVGIQSEPGKGSTFWFTLPIAEQEEE